ncbi:MAG: hypothetical protein ACRD0W_00890 [Acidimicrobiales bacterium]
MNWWRRLRHRCVLPPALGGGMTFVCGTCGRTWRTVWFRDVVWVTANWAEDLGDWEWVSP